MGASSDLGSAAVVLDVTPLETRLAGRGVGAYLRGLLSGLEQLGELHATWGFAGRINRNRVRPDLIVPHLGVGGLWSAWPQLALWGGPTMRPDDVVHFTSFLASGVRPPGPYLATVYDFIPWRFPNQYLHTSWRRFLYRRYLDHLRRATHLMAISQAVAADASEVLGRDPEAVTVTPLGVPPLPDPGEASPAESYLFLAGTPQPHKNLRFALETVGALPASVRPPVVVTGYQGDRRWGPILALAAQRGVTLEHRGHVSRRELSTLYAGAAAVLVTSDYEGFGLPVVEALSVGARVLCSDRGALPEVAGPAEVLPLKREAWTLRLREVLGGEPHNPEPGRRWAARFTWERTARATLEAYRRLA